MNWCRRSVLVFGSFLAAAAGLVAYSTGAPAAQSSADGLRAVLAPGSCYRLVLPVQAAPQYKVVELLDGGWIRAEIDAGPASAKRDPIWLNSAQIVAVRTARCSE